MEYPQHSKQNLALLPCTILKGVGAKLAEHLQRCDIQSIQDLLFHLPMHYQDRTHISPIANLRIGDFAVIEGVVTQTEISKGRRPSLVVHLRDGTDEIKLRFIHFYPNQQKIFSEGVHLRCYGEVRHNFSGKELVHPDYQVLTSTQPLAVDETLTPVYPTTQGLGQKVLRSLMNQALEMMGQGESLPEYLPNELLNEYQLLSLQQALEYVHRPPPDAALEQLELGVHPAQRRLVFEELLAYRLSLLNSRAQTQSVPAPAIQHQAKFQQQFLTLWPYQLTQAQQRVVSEIQSDLGLTQPMLRLVQGDVGSGKTMVALLAILHVIESGHQAVLMAPTELLAEQHFNNFSQWLPQLGINVNWLVGRHKGKQRKDVLANIQSGAAAVIIGTHALFQEGVEFYNLALVVIDEQHRFGVHQRLALWEKGKRDDRVPHQLIMTATPIPRTLAMTAYADLDVSVIDELPPGRKPITTVVVPNDKRLQVIERIRLACLHKQQCYWVCPLIDESETLACQAAEATYAQLVQALPELKIGLVHGRSKTEERDITMSAFKDGKVDVLVATTVIEVGVDVANASLMIIENAERMGLAQLHQLRGRVGRGSRESYCVLLYQGPLTQNAHERLGVLRDSQDGFLIAQKDLELRGPGELLGTRQTGMLQFRIANLKRDQDLLPLIEKAAALVMDKYPTAAKTLIQRWVKSAEKYAQV